MRHLSRVRQVCDEEGSYRKNGQFLSRDNYKTRLVGVIAVYIPPDDSLIW